MKNLRLDVEQQLRSFGWFPGRRMDQDELAQWIQISRRERGCYIFREAIEILREFGGLTLNPSLGTSAIHINPLSGRSIVDTPDLWHYWEWKINEVLFPLGATGNADTLYAVSTSGIIYTNGVVDLSWPDFGEALADLVLVKPASNDREFICARDNDEAEYENMYRLAFPEDWRWGNC